MKDSLTEDWITLWQSELAAIAADREVRESWTGLAALWANALNAALPFIPRQGDELYREPPAGTAGAAQPPRTAAAAAAPELGGDAARQPYERIAELESRLAAFERREGIRSPARPAGYRNA